MNNATRISETSKNITAFFVLTFVMSVPPYILASLVPQEMVMLIGLIIALAPITAALILAYRANRAEGAKSLLKRCFDYKSITRKIWYAPILFLMPVLFLLALGITILTGETLPEALFPVAATPVAFLMFFIFALFEEIGWMGYAFDPMEKRWNALVASIILGSIWATWHIPLYMLSGQDSQRVIVQLLSLAAIRTLIVWLYNNTGKNVFATILIHAVYNVCTLAIASFYTSLGHLITCIFILIIAVIVAFLWDPETLTQYRFTKKKNE
ncbi:MAG: CPBP family intramembrane metalloprotease [Chloroflexi bacterium]|nr:CPBP family intramembrane metalloprotease [Chloroflexota bacterium]